MTNIQAINLLKGLWQSLDDYCELNDEGKAAFCMAIEALSCSEIPNSSDTISREAAVDALDKRFDSIPMEQTTDILLLRKDLRELPSAQPEKRTEERTETHACDCISRQAAIDVILADKIVGNALLIMKAIGESDKALTLNSACDRHIRDIEQLPSAQPEQHWISVSERLPEDIKPVLVTWKNNDPASYYQYIVGNHYIGTAHFKSDKWYWYSSVTEDLLAEYGRCDSEEFDEAIEVIAWMPLPEPYKEESNGKNV